MKRHYDTANGSQRERMRETHVELRVAGVSTPEMASAAGAEG